MGALHAGHVSLVEAARKECDCVVTSIFVNPKQFGPHEDFHKYPRTLSADVELLGNKVDLVFAPEVSDMYPNEPMVTALVNGMEKTSEGASRPGHFSGVATVVAKLLNIVQPHTAFFGQKDAHQCIVIRNLIRDMNFPVQLEIVPTMREADGLAMSSRNRYLSPEQRKLAPILYQALLTAKNLVEKEQVYSRGPLVDSALRVLEQPGVTVDYISLASLEDGREIDLITNKHPLLLSGAIKIGTTRLIDNLIAQPL
eukprot:TRINITY_DN4433_c0_g1_i2.p1 TRINITY_DN4433_c0_g1~~TRINITY_DN4433_c0_g1_i2.p1  ORF type:complete len:294 (+),score=48.81 TRINITY_DN4433_c0_g1_i2:120-884(+)